MTDLDSEFHQTFQPFNPCDHSSPLLISLNLSAFQGYHLGSDPEFHPILPTPNPGGSLSCCSSPYDLLKTLSFEG